MLMKQFYFYFLPCFKSIVKLYVLNFGFITLCYISKQKYCFKNVEVDP